MDKTTIETLSSAENVIRLVTQADAARTLALLDDIKQETTKLKSLEADLAGTQAKAAALAEERKAFESTKVIHAGEVEAAKSEAAGIKQAYERKAAELETAKAAHAKTVAAHQAQLDELARFKQLVQ